MNPFTVLAELAVGFWKAGKAQAWARLIFQLMASGAITFLIAGGLSLVGTAAGRIPAAWCWVIGVGNGMWMAGVCMTVLWRKSPLTKGMLLVLPSEEAAKELESNLEVIQK
jgi:hypothetical protein